MPSSKARCAIVTLVTSELRQAANSIGMEVAKVGQTEAAIVATSRIVVEEARATMVAIVFVVYARRPCVMA